MAGTADRFFINEGRFAVDGVGLEELVRVGGTPQYAYSAATIRAKYARLADSFGGCDVFYSLKANPNPRIVRLLAKCGAGAEVSSAGELQTALGAGIAPAHIIWVGPAKTEADVRLAVEKGIYAVVADWPGELEWLEALACAAGRKVRALLRINTRESRPEAKEVMVGGPSKFGFDEETVVEQVAGLQLECARIAGIQVYSASQVLDSAWLDRHLEYVASLALRLSGQIGFELECVDFGGGFGIPYDDGQSELDLRPAAAAMRRMRQLDPQRLGKCRILFESGRYLVAESGVFLTRVVRTKESRGRRFVITDGGMNAFSRPVFMGIRHPAQLVSRPAERADGAWDVCGPICTPLDCTGRDAALPAPRPGDVVGFFNAGAYGYSMTLLDFMSLGQPAEVLCEDGRAELVREPVRYS
jgi:diaminopimelate decarboxylase